MSTKEWPLPPELTDLIISLIQVPTDGVNRSTLRSCANVSREWRSLTLPHLFSTFTQRRPFGFDSFATLFPYILPFIRTFRFGLNYMISQPAAVIVDTLSTHLLPGLRRLKFDADISNSSLDPLSSRVGSSTFRTNSSLVKEIEVGGGSLYYTWPFLSFSFIISLFPNLQKLSLRSIYGDIREPAHVNPTDFPYRFPPISSLKITPEKRLWILVKAIEWISRSPHIAQLQSIRELKLLLNPTLIRDPVFLQFMTAVGPSIKHLRIRSPSELPTKNEFAPDLLASMTHLVSLQYLSITIQEPTSRALDVFSTSLICANVLPITTLAILISHRAEFSWTSKDVHCILQHLIDPDYKITCLEKVVFILKRAHSEFVRQFSEWVSDFWVMHELEHKWSCSIRSGLRFEP